MRARDGGSAAQPQGSGLTTAGALAHGSPAEEYPLDELTKIESERRPPFSGGTGRTLISKQEPFAWAKRSFAGAEGSRMLQMRLCNQRRFFCFDGYVCFV